MATWPELLERVMQRGDLTTADTTWVMDQVLTDQASPVGVAALLAALRTKGETVEEVAGFAAAMISHATSINVPGRTVDVVGTGGDGLHTVNISTMASIVVAATGTTVVKHGNRAATSKSGSADVLAELGVNLEIPPERVAQVAQEAGITFCFAMVFHPAMRFAGPIRKEMGVPTTFNILGPLTNPAQPQASAIGVASESLAPVIAGVMALQKRDAIVFRNTDGLDELAATARTDVWEVRAGSVEHSTIDPVADLNMTPITLEDLRGGEASENAVVARRVFGGEAGAALDTVALNAAAGLVADGRLPGTNEGSLIDRMKSGLVHARGAIEAGEAERVLARWVEATSK